MVERKWLYNLIGSLDFIGKFFFTNKLRVLAYHKIEDEETFEHQIKYHCCPIKKEAKKMASLNES